MNVGGLEQLNAAINMYINTAPTSELVLLLSFSLLILAIKGLALWTASQNNSKWWFIALLFLNTLGILEIVYLLFFVKRGRTQKIK